MWLIKPARIPNDFVHCVQEDHGSQAHDRAVTPSAACPLAQLPVGLSKARERERENEKTITCSNVQAAK